MNERTFSITVKTGSSKSDVVSGADETFTVYTHAHPVDGEANEAVVKLLAEYFDVAKRYVEIVSGHTSKKKVVKIRF